MPKPIKLVLVAMFNPSGEQPGELGVFVDNEGFRPADPGRTGLDGRIYERDDGLLAIHAGVGSSNTAVSTMALAMSGDYDLSKAYWLISGIAGASPGTCPLGSVNWVDWAIDGDVAFELDVREIPPEWSTGIIPLGATEPFGPGMKDDVATGPRYEVNRLNPALVRWALELTRGVELLDTPEMAACRAQYTGFDTIQGPPVVTSAANLTTSHFWHGKSFNDWATRWVEHWTEGQGTFFTSGMEDTGTLHALRHLTKLGLADYDRTLLLRAASNFTYPPPGVTVMENLFAETGGDANYPGYAPSLENARRAGMMVINTLLENWKSFHTQTPIK